ncbi:MAG: hypothetical protein JOZ40_06295, partial [Methylobacteriaceae bacterium]|nr:hypothetical protein [Methylobacteriaceae bacterium]
MATLFRSLGEIRLQYFVAVYLVEVLQKTRGNCVLKHIVYGDRLIKETAKGKKLALRKLETLGAKIKDENVHDAMQAMLSVLNLLDFIVVTETGKYFL